MSSLSDDISRKARSLPAEDRARLAEELLTSLHADEQEDPEIEAAWNDEIRRRLDEIDAGTAKLIPAAEAFAEVRRMLK